jgi:thioredoxin
MKKVFLLSFVLFAFILGGCGSSENGEKAQDVKTSAKADLKAEEIPKTEETTAGKKDPDAKDIKPEHITAKIFKEKIWNYEQNPSKWVYEGDLPCVVDFYADWCRPCKMVAPIMDDLADYYDGRVLFYKVNTDEQRELASVFQIRSIPSILFAPKNGKPSMQAGAMSKEQYIKIIDEYVLGNKQTADNNGK